MHRIIYSKLIYTAQNHTPSKEKSPLKQVWYILNLHLGKDLLAICFFDIINRRQLQEEPSLCRYSIGQPKYKVTDTVHNFLHMYKYLLQYSAVCSNTHTPIYIRIKCIIILRLNVHIPVD